MKCHFATSFFKTLSVPIGEIFFGVNPSLPKKVLVGVDVGINVAFFRKVVASCTP